MHLNPLPISSVSSIIDTINNLISRKLIKHCVLYYSISLKFYKPNIFWDGCSVGCTTNFEKEILNIICGLKNL